MSIADKIHISEELLEDLIFDGDKAISRIIQMNLIKDKIYTLFSIDELELIIEYIEFNKKKKTIKLLESFIDRKEMNRCQ